MTSCLEFQSIFGSFWCGPVCAQNVVPKLGFRARTLLSLCMQTGITCCLGTELLIQETNSFLTTHCLGNAVIRSKTFYSLPVCYREVFSIIALDFNAIPCSWTLNSFKVWLSAKTLTSPLVIQRKYFPPLKDAFLDSGGVYAGIHLT